MRAVLISSPGHVSIVSRLVPELRPTDVLVAVALTGVCGTDLHVLDGHMPTARFPLVPGHEVTGTVEQVGAEVTSVRPGERVVLDPGVPCRQCARCRQGRFNLCENRLALGISLDGGAAEYVVAPGPNWHVVGPDVPDRVAVLAEPLACVLHAFDLAPPVAGNDVLVYGAGTIGLLAVQVAQCLGANTVTVVDRSEDRLPGARAVGADAVTTHADALDAPAAWDLVIDATGAPAAIEDGLDRVQRGGTFLQVGVAPAGAAVSVSPYQVFAREMRIIGSMTTSFTFPRAIALLAQGVIDDAEIVGEPMPLSQYCEAVEVSRAGTVRKVVVDPRLDPPDPV